MRIRDVKTKIYFQIMNNDCNYIVQIESNTTFHLIS